MKDIDWSKAPDDCIGAIKHTGDGSVSYEYGRFITGFGDCISHYGHYCGEDSVYPAKDSYMFIPRPAEKTKPVYTQAMSDAGELPSVGMECLVKHKHQDNTMWAKCFIVGLNKDGDYLVFDHEIRGLEQHHIKNGTYDFTSMPTPIELIDGKAYQFDYGSNPASLLNIGLIGTYDNNGSLPCFWVKDTPWYLQDCTNIKILTVEGES